MGKAFLRNFTLVATRPRRASTLSVGPYAVKNEKTMICSDPDCGRGFSRRGDLKRHEQLHTGVKNHECPVCQKRFSQNSGLKTHMNVHTGNKPYRCAFEGCGAEFGDPSSHARHKKETHIVDYHYVCNAHKCGSAIKRRSAFTQHLVKKHGVVASAKEIDAMRKPFRSPIQRRETNDVAHTPVHTPAPAHYYYVDNIDRNFITLHANNHSSKTMTIKEQNDPLVPRGTFFDHKLEPDYYLNAGHLQQRDIEPSFTPPTLSSATLSTFSTQSSTETLVEDLKYDDYTSAKLYFNDTSDQNQTINPLVHLTTSIPPSPATSPFSKDEYHLSPTPMSIQELQRMNPQIASDQQRYTPPSMSGTPHLSYQFNHKSYAIPQDKDADYSLSHFNIVPQQVAHQWGPWGFA